MKDVPARFLVESSEGCPSGMKNADMTLEDDILALSINPESCVLHKGLRILMLKISREWQALI